MRPICDHDGREGSHDAARPRRKTPREPTTASHVSPAISRVSAASRSSPPNAPERIRTSDLRFRRHRNRDEHALITAGRVQVSPVGSGHYCRVWDTTRDTPPCPSGLADAALAAAGSQSEQRVSEPAPSGGHTAPRRRLQLQPQVRRPASSRVRRTDRCSCHRTSTTQATARTATITTITAYPVHVSQSTPTMAATTNPATSGGRVRSATRGSPSAERELSRTYEPTVEPMKHPKVMANSPDPRRTPPRKRPVSNVRCARSATRPRPAPFRHPLRSASRMRRRARYRLGSGSTSRTAALRC